MATRGRRGAPPEASAGSEPEGRLVQADQGPLFQHEGFVVYATGLQGPTTAPDYEVWRGVGGSLYRLGNATCWALGDWLAYGEHAYGEKYADAIAETEYSKQALKDMAWVSGSIPRPSRYRDVSWSHHREVAALPAPDRDAMLRRISTEGLSIKQVRELLRESNHRARTVERAWPAGRHGVIYCDPPWRFDDGVTDASREAENQYPTMSAEELAAMAERIASVAASDCVLLMWAVAQKLDEAVDLIRAWGFELKSGKVWVKDSIGMGHWYRGRHELLLLATKGSPATPLEDVRPDSVLQSPRRGHSQKPDELYAEIEAMFPGVPKIELFARACEARPRGWTTWGNEALDAPKPDVEASGSPIEGEVMPPMPPARQDDAFTFDEANPGDVVVFTQTIGNVLHRVRGVYQGADEKAPRTRVKIEMLDGPRGGDTLTFKRGMPLAAIERAEPAETGVEAVQASM